MAGEPFDADLEDRALAALLEYQTHDDRSRRLAIAQPGDFFQGAHAAVAEAIAVLHDRTEEVTPATIANALKGHAIGTRAIETARRVFFHGDPVGGDRHLELVHEAARERRLEGAARDLLVAAQSRETVAPHLEAIGTILDDQGNTNDGTRLGIVTLDSIAGDRTPPTLLEVAGGVPLLYEPAVHSLYGSGGTGKTWLALHAGLEHARTRPGGVLVLDYENGAGRISARLDALGASPEEKARFHYLAGREFSRDDLRRLVREAVRRTIGFVIVDSLAGALEEQGQSENAAEEVTRFMRKTPEAFWAEGMTVLVLDHPGKDGTRGPRGSIAKLDRVHVAYALDTVTPFSDSNPGRAVVRVDKDRHGTRPVRSTAAIVNYTPTADGLRIEVTTDTPTPDAGEWKPSELMARVSAWLEAEGPEFTFTMRDLDRQPRPVKGKSGYVREAVRHLERDGFLTSEEDGPATRYRLARPYPAGPAPRPDRGPGPEPTSTADRGPRVPAWPLRGPDAAHLPGEPLTVTAAPAAALYKSGPGAAGHGTPWEDPEIF